MLTYLRRSFTPCSYCGYFSLHPECLTPKRDHQGQSGSSFLAEGNTYSHFTHYVSPLVLPPLVRRYSRVLGHRKQCGQKKDKLGHQARVRSVKCVQIPNFVRSSGSRGGGLSAHLMGAAASQMALPRKILVCGSPSFMASIRKVLV